MAAWPGPGPESFRDGASPGKLRPQTELMQPIPTSHQTCEAVLVHSLAPRDPLLARLHNLCSHSLGVEVEARSEANK